MEKRTKTILIISIIIVLIMIILTLFALVDFSKAVKGKTPIFIYHKASVESFEPNIKTNYYYGIGYTVIKCEKPNESWYYNFQFGYKSKHACFSE